MGTAASNLSSTDLQTYQSSISEVFQSIQNEASNLTTQQVDLSQEINVTVGTTPPPTNPCADRVDVLQACDKSNCRDKEDIYQCQFKGGTPVGATTVSLCDEAFGYTSQEANDQEGFCNGGTGSTTVPESALYTICQNKLLRKTCFPNPPGSYISWNNVSCSSSADCPTGTTCDLNLDSEQYGYCGVKTIPGSFESTCGGTCGTKTIYQIEYIQDGKRKFTLDTSWTLKEINDEKIGSCGLRVPSKEGEKCYRAYNLDEYYDCVKVQKERKIPPNCAADCKSLYSCTPEELEAFKPVQAELNVIGGSICLQNKASSTFVSKQVAEATTKAILESAITNQFQNDITKTITQKNKGINFNQENNSQERTSITQKVRNTISQAISSASSNQTVQGDATKQVINFTVASGKVTISKDCGKESGCITSNPTIPGQFCPGGGLVISNDAISDMNSTQTSRSVVDALLNSGILNDLSNKYSFTAEQTNDNDILGGLFALLMGYIVLIVVVAIIALVTAGFLAKTSLSFLNSLLDVLKKIWIPTLVVAVLAGAGVGIYFAVRPTTTTTNTNPSGQPPRPLPSDPSQPGNNEIECKIGNTVGCNCSIFVTEEAADKLTENQKKEICAPFISNLQTNLTSTISEQCSEIYVKDVKWGNPPTTEFTSKFCEETSEKACSLRNFTSPEGIRAYCKPVAGLAPIPTGTPNPTLPPA